MRAANTARGEVVVSVAGRSLILASDMERLVAFENATGGASLVDIMRDLARSRVTTIRAGLLSLAIEGDAEAAIAEIRGAGELPEIAGKIVAVLSGGESQASAGNAASGTESR